MKLSENIWYQNSLPSKLLLPISWLYCVLTVIRRILYKLRIIPSKKLPVPVIVVGNINVGGTGKTPLVIWLALKLLEEGFRPGIISRGYKGKARHWPQQVRSDSDPIVVGDEPVIIARRTKCPMAVGPDRVEAAKQLLKYHDCNVIISDDGLQHYKMRRDIEILVIDANRKYGNSRCLPAGPLREPKWRARKADFIIENNSKNISKDSISMYFDGDIAVNLCDKKQKKSLDQFVGIQDVFALAGIGNPNGFFNFLKSKSLKFTESPFSDHHKYIHEDIVPFSGKTLLMTEKDAVKLERYAETDFWYIPIEAKVQSGFKDNIITLLRRKHNG